MKAKIVDIQNAKRIAYRIRWYIGLRWALLLALLLSGVSGEILTSGFTTQVLQAIATTASGFVINALLWLFARTPNKSAMYYSVLGMLLVISDIVLSTYLVFSRGGVESRTVILYAIPIVLAGAIFGKLGIYLSAGLSALLYIVVITLDITNILPPQNIRTPHLHSDLAFGVTTLMFYPATFFIIGALSSFVTNLLKYQEEKYRVAAWALAKAQHTSRLGSWEWDIKNDRIQWSDELYRLFGLEPSSIPITYSSYAKRVVPADQEKIRQIIKQSMGSLEPFEFDHGVVWPDKAVHYLHAIGEVVADSTGKAVLMRGTAQDITKRFLAEQKLAKQTEEMANLNRLMIGRELKMVELKKALKRSAEQHHV